LWTGNKRVGDLDVLPRLVALLADRAQLAPLCRVHSGATARRGVAVNGALPAGILATSGGVPVTSTLG
jgi:hypothetical protein